VCNLCIGYSSEIIFALRTIFSVRSNNLQDVSLRDLTVLPCSDDTLYRQAKRDRKMMRYVLGTQIVRMIA